VSKGPGVWQKEILRVTSGVCVATVSGIVRARLPEPHRDAFVAARRGARGLALAQRVSAVYAYACMRCGQIQDSETPGPCCGPVRPMLAVARPDRRRLLLHPAPPPGGVAPSWINVAVPSRPPGQLAVPSFEDLADLVVRRCYEGLQSGRPTVSLQDAAAVMRLAWQIERDEAIPERDAARRKLEKWQQDMTEFTWVLRSVLDREYPGAWPALMAEVRKRRPAAPQ